MARLPVPGQDAGTWGGILNEYLQVSHNNDGSLKPVNASNVQITPGGDVSASNVQSAIQELDQEKLSRVGGGKETVVSANSGSSYTVNLASGSVFNITLTGNCTFAFSGATNGVMCSFTLFVSQDGTGGRTVTWPGSVKWSAGAAPTLPTTGNAVSILSFLTINGGSTWFGFVAGEDMA